MPQPHGWYYSPFLPLSLSPSLPFTVACDVWRPNPEFHPCNFLHTYKGHEHVMRVSGQRLGTWLPLTGDQIDTKQLPQQNQSKPIAGCFKGLGQLHTKLRNWETDLFPICMQLTRPTRPKHPATIFDWLCYRYLHLLKTVHLYQTMYTMTGFDIITLLHLQVYPHNRAVTCWKRPKKCGFKSNTHQRWNP